MHEHVDTAKCLVLCVHDMHNLDTIMTSGGFDRTACLTGVWPGDVLQMGAPGKVMRSWGQIKVYGRRPEELL